MTSEELDRLWDYQKPRLSEQRFRDLLGAPELDAATRAEVFTQIARAQGLQGNFAAAHQTLDDAEAMLREDVETSSRPRIRCLLERGRLYNSSGAPVTAAPCFVAAWEQASASGDDFYAADAAHMLGIVGTSPEQIAWSRRALDFVERSRDVRTKRWLAPIANNLVWTFFDLGDYSAALDLFEDALHQYQESGTPQNIRIARWSIAKTLRYLNRVDEALSIQCALQQELLDEGATDPYVDEELAEIAKLVSEDGSRL